MSLTIDAVANQLTIPPKELWQQALQAFLKEQARFYNIERLRLCQKYGVASLQEMDALVVQGKVDEETILTDFQRVDFLTAKLRQLNDLMVEVCRELGPVDTMRFVGQFTVGCGDYTAERDALFADMTLEDMIAEIKQGRSQAGTQPQRQEPNRQR